MSKSNSKKGINKHLWVIKKWALYSTYLIHDEHRYEKWKKTVWFDEKHNKDRTETINDLWAGWEPDELSCYIINENVTRSVLDRFHDSIKAESVEVFPKTARCCQKQFLTSFNTVTNCDNFTSSCSLRKFSAQLFNAYSLNL